MNIETITLLQQKRIILGVTGSIAAYKAVDLASKLTQHGGLVDVIMTAAAQQFVTPLTFQAVTGRPVYADLWQTENSGGLPTHIAHVGLAEAADVLAIIPATADCLARLAHGFASDLLAITVLAARCPLMIAPAMDGGMYEHTATQANIRTLIERGATVIEPETGRFASGLSGRGRLPETPILMGAIRQALGKNGVLTGKRVVVTAGGTREPLDPVRYIGNRSSGKQGYALAQAALDAGADVTLISTVQHLPFPYGAALISVETAQDMLDAVLRTASSADALIMAAAVADFHPQARAEHKIKKTSENESGFTLELERTADILAAIKEQRDDGAAYPRVVVGFAAESHDLIANATEKMTRKGVDLLVANDISADDAGFESETNRVILLHPHGVEERLPLMSKAQVAERVIGRVAGLV
jgi:phosphopantothenoylcysteine decarboxylase/phosphopantothenate--cysteine ligase